VTTSSAEAPETELLRPYNLCPHVKQIILENIHEALVCERFEVAVDEPAAAERARLAV
jgi:quinolinate synthase